MDKYQQAKIRYRRFTVLATLAIANTACVSSSSEATQKTLECDTHILSKSERKVLKANILGALSLKPNSQEGSAFFSENDVFISVGGLRMGHQDVIAYVNGRFLCGSGGCDALIFKNVGDLGDPGYDLIGDITLARLPITLLETSHQGWRDIGTPVFGGGIRQAYTAALSYDGKSYDSNPTLPNLPKVKDGQVDRILIGKDQAGSNQCRLT